MVQWASETDIQQAASNDNGGKAGAISRWLNEKRLTNSKNRF
jgi:hypothetical protein